MPLDTGRKDIKLKQRSTKLIQRGTKLRTLKGATQRTVKAANQLSTPKISYFATKY